MIAGRNSPHFGLVHLEDLEGGSSWLAALLATFFPCNKPKTYLFCENEALRSRCSFAHRNFCLCLHLFSSVFNCSFELNGIFFVGFFNMGNFIAETVVQGLLTDLTSRSSLTLQVYNTP